jgi:hypothetical protein
MPPQYDPELKKLCTAVYMPFPKTAIPNRLCPRGAPYQMRDKTYHGGTETRRRFLSKIPTVSWPTENDPFNYEALHGFLGAPGIFTLKFRSVFLRVSVSPW